MVSKPSPRSLQKVVTVGKLVKALSRVASCDATPKPDAITIVMVNSSQANSREYLRQAIDAEIKSLEESIRALRHRRNALAPISSLPTEVIATIFSFFRVPRTSSH